MKKFAIIAALTLAAIPQMAHAEDLKDLFCNGKEYYPKGSVIPHIHCVNSAEAILKVRSGKSSHPILGIKGKVNCASLRTRIDDYNWADETVKDRLVEVYTSKKCTPAL